MIIFKSLPVHFCYQSVDLSTLHGQLPKTLHSAADVYAGFFGTHFYQDD